MNDQINLNEKLSVISLTIIIPTLNCAATLTETLMSVEPLRRRGARIIVVDSYSVDQTVKLAGKHEVEVVYVPAGNMYKAINLGIDLAQTDWVTYLNGDDLLYADAVLSAFDEFSACADVIYGSIDYIDINGRFLHSWNSPHDSDILPLAKSHVNAIPQQGALFRRHVATQLGGFATFYRFASDYDFFLRAKLMNFRFAKLEFPRIAAFRLHGVQISQHKGAEMRVEVRHSTSVNKLSTTRLFCNLALYRLRIYNWDSYALRMLRSRHICGKLAMRKSIEC